MDATPDEEPIAIAAATLRLLVELGGGWTTQAAIGLLGGAVRERVATEPCEVCAAAGRYVEHCEADDRHIDGCAYVGLRRACEAPRRPAGWEPYSYPGPPAPPFAVGKTYHVEIPLCACPCARCAECQR